jgi:hypothetical protein
MNLFFGVLSAFFQLKRHYLAISPSKVCDFTNFASQKLELIPFGLYEQKLLF